ncbi:MAG: diguanylate cyclase [Candidatus Fermentibacteria bacterium]|nr:diguanylate cyclase [Candidatus Fermentibacteria bacterium]
MKRIDVLLAMGSPALSAVTEEALLREGLSVKTVTNGLDAVTAAFSLKPRCVLCGQVLAGMDGIKVCRFLSTVYSREEMPVIVSVPDINPRIRRKALSASAVDVIDYSTPFTEIIKLINSCISSVRASSIHSSFNISHERIVLLTADNLEDSLESIETVVTLASDLGCVTSIPEACRKVVLAVLGGLGFQRVWVGLLDGAATTVEAVAFRGRGITGEAIHLSGMVGHLPVDLAVKEGVQVTSWEPAFRDNRETWVGSVTYVDTPIRAGSKVFGIIRCDNGISRKLPSDGSLQVLKMLAGELSLFIRYIDAQGRLETFKNMFGQFLNKLSCKVISLSEPGLVEEIHGEPDTIPVIGSVFPGASLRDILDFIPEEPREVVLNAGLEKRDTLVSTTSIHTGDLVELSLMHRKSGGMTLLVSDCSIRGNLEKKIELLKFETDAIASLAADLTSLVDPGEICRTLLRTLESFYPDEAISILAASEVSSSIVPEKLIVHAVSGSGHRDAAIPVGAVIQVTENSSESSVISEAVRTGRTINIPDVLQSGIFMATLPDIRSELAIPMLSRGRVVGVINFESTLINRFLVDDIRRLNNLLGFTSGVLETALQQTELIKLARRDRLTGLYNMTFFEERYPEEFERADRYEYSFSLIMMDIDDFKHYNDSFGHPMGNILLQKLTRAMSGALRDVDMLVRYGGEEFVCILPLTDKQVAEEIAERIRTTVIEASKGIPNATEQPRGFVSLSLGVATFPEDSREKDELLEIADQRMYRAKGAGKNRVCCN